MPTNLTTLESLRPDQIADLRALAINPRHPMVASRIGVFRYLGLITPASPPRPPRDSRARKAPPRRAFKLTELGLQVIAQAPTTQPAQNHVGRAGWK